MRSGTGGLGRSLGIAVIGLVVLGAAAFLADAAFPGLISPVTLILGAGATAGLFTLAGSDEARRRRVVDEKIASELDALSRRFLRIEERVSTLNGSDSTITDIAGDVSTLGSVVRDLAEALASQERDVATLRARAEKSPTHRPWDPLANLDDVLVPHRKDGAVVPSLFPAIDVALASASEVAPPSESSAQARRPRLRPDADELVRALQAGQLDLHVQPIVSLPQRRTKIYEVYALLRISDSQVLVPEEFIPTLDEFGQLPELDGKVLARAMTFARSLAAAGSEAFVNCALSAPTLRDPRHLFRLQGILEADSQIASRMILEVPQTAWTEFGATDGRLSGLREYGVGFCIGKVASRHIDPYTLARAGVRLLKVPAADLLEATDGWGETLPLALSHHDIQLVAERVVADDTIPELIELKVPLAQGFAFAFPSPVQTVLAELRPASASKAGAPVAAAGGAVPSEDRIPLRSFLKRNS